MKFFRFSLLLLVGVAGSVARAVEPVAYSYVAGFERFPKDMRDEAGLLMLGELGCVHCHDFGQQERQISAKAAPDLSEVAFRSDPAFLAEYIANPQQTHPGTTMPDVLGGGETETDTSVDTKTDADAKARAITHYLVARSTKPFRRTAPDLVAVQRGRELYNTVGCVACHVAHPGEKDEQLFDGAIRPFPELIAKYSVNGLKEFLRDPLHVRRSGRMPSLRLSEREADDIANYLLRESQVSGPVSFQISTGGRRDLNDDGQQVAFSTGITEGLSLPRRQPRYRFTAKFSGQVNIAKEGEYTFHWQSSGALRWKLSDQTIVDRSRPPNRDQLHRGQKTIALQPGWHSFSLEFFEPRSTRTLKVEWKGPGFARQSIPSRLLRHQPPNEKDSEVAQSPRPREWKVDDALLQKGKKWFLSEGCVNCHDHGIDKNTIQFQRRSFRDKDQFAVGEGCLTRGHIGAPKYTLNRSQRQALRSALHKIYYDTFEEPSTDDLVTRNLTRLNCYACHERGFRGGVSESRETFFTCTEKDLGGEGRFPPTLTGVGGKLRMQWLSDVVENGASVRPYMKTRMPRFGGGNVPDLAKNLVRLDLDNKKLPAAVDEKAIAKKVGRELTGKGKLQCVSCHKFNGHDAAGLQALDLTTATRRLNREWFHQYMLNPAVLRPGTRMPQSWPGGESFFQDILDGDTRRQIDAIWTYLEDGELAINPDGLVPQNKELVVAGKAVVYRNKLWEAGFRGIAVGFPDHVNMAFDAERKRLALLWKNRFLNVTPHWSVQSMGRIRPSGTDVVKLPNAPPFAFLEKEDSRWPAFGDDADVPIQFRGYQLDELDRPTLMYDLLVKEQSFRIEDFSTGSRTGNTFILNRKLTITRRQSSGSDAAVSPDQRIGLLLFADDQVTATQNNYQCGEKLSLRLELPDSATPRIQNENQLRVIFRPASIHVNEPIQIGVQYRW